ncbi:MAG: zinc ribbon domain-containing protein [Dehalococcoidales bacterium]
MPIYEYVCSECDSKFEQMRPLSQSSLAADCPRCHKPARRKMSVFAAFSTSEGNVPQSVPGAGGHSCSSCSSGNCSTCAS